MSYFRTFGFLALLAMLGICAWALYNHNQEIATTKQEIATTKEDISTTSESAEEAVRESKESQKRIGNLGERVKELQDRVDSQPGSKDSKAQDVEIRNLRNQVADLELELAMQKEINEERFRVIKETFAGMGLAQK